MDSTKIRAQYSNGESEYSITIHRFTSALKASQSFLEKDSGEFDVRNINGVDYYILSNIDNRNVTWTVDNLQVIISGDLSDDEINSAIKATEDYFKKEFGGCTLTKITYAGDTESLNETAYRKENGYDYDKVIVLVSSFKTDSFGGDGSLNPNSTYDNWDWIMGEKHGGKWENIDHGYA